MPEQNQPDSIVSAQERAAKIREESARIEAEQSDAAELQRQHQEALEQYARREEAARLAMEAAKISDVGSREQVLQRVRDMRANPPPMEPPPAPLQRSERAQAEFDAEQACGRAAVAKEEAIQAAHRERWMKEEQAEEAKKGTMEQVFRPNELPSAAALLGPRKTGYGRT